MDNEYYEVSFEEIGHCKYTIEAPSKKAALKFAMKLWKDEHKNIPVFSCLSHYQMKKLPQKTSEHYGKKDIKKFLSKP